MDGEARAISDSARIRTTTISAIVTLMTGDFPSDVLFFPRVGLY